MKNMFLNPSVEVYTDPDLNAIIDNLYKNHFIDLEDTDNWMYVFLTSYDGYSFNRVRIVASGEPGECNISCRDPVVLSAYVMDTLLGTDNE